MSEDGSSDYTDFIISILRESGRFGEDELERIEEILQNFLV